jgi:hypothetical protein
MYFFARFNGYMNIIFGILMMLVGIALPIYGFLNNAALVDLANNFLLSGTIVRLLDARFYAATLGLILFLSGMGLAGSGQLMLAFADTAAQARETTALLRGMNRGG